MLKAMIEKLEDVAEPLRELYEPAADGKFILKIDLKSHPEFLAVLSNKNEILEEKRKQKERIKELETLEQEKKVKELEGAKDYEKALALERQRFSDELAAATAKTAALNKQLRDNMVDGLVNTMAAELAGERAEIIAPHIKARIEVVDKDGELKLFIKDAAGINSSMTKEQLKKEFEESKLYAPLIAGRKSSGGDAGTGSGEGGEDFDKFFDSKNPAYSITEQNKLMASNKPLFDALAAKHDPLKALGM